MINTVLYRLWRLRRPLIIAALILPAAFAASAWIEGRYWRAELLEGSADVWSAYAIYVALVAANVYVMLFNMTWGPVLWIMLGEMFPNQIRGTGLAVSGLAQWGSNFGITMTFPIMLAGVGLAGAYGFYTACAVVSIFFVARMVHETKGLELEEMKG